MPTQSTSGMCDHGLGTGYFDWDMAGKRVFLSFVWAVCLVLWIWFLPKKIIGINLSSNEYALVSDAHKE